MRLFIIASALSTAGPSLPVFSFMGDTTEAPTTRTELGGEPCGTDGTIKTCRQLTDVKLGGTSLRWLSLRYNNDKLYQVIGAFYPNRYTDILAAFTAKYGPPKISSEKWQARSGASFDNTKAAWQFKGGILELEALGPDLDTGTFVFSSIENAPPKAAPKIDF